MADISLEQFTAEAKAFLDANAKLKAEERTFVWGEGPDDAGLFDEIDREKEKTEIELAKEWRRKKFDAGFGYIFGSKQFGGRELPNAYDRAYASLEAKYDVPNQSPFGISLGMVAPTIVAHAIDDVKNAYVRKLYRGDLIACQLFSEPGAGSDLAGLQMKAERDGDEWLLTGQKVWTSGAHYSDIGEVIARTDPDQPKHKGLTCFVVDMKAPGVDIVPLRQMTGGANFNEVFFNEVRVHDSHRLGDMNQGWGVALTTLMNERASIGAGGGGGGGASSGFTRLREMVRHFGLADDPVVRQKLMHLYVNQRVASYNNQRALDKIKAGQAPGPEMSIAKLSLTDNLREASQFVSDILGPRLIADSGEWGTFSMASMILGTPGMSIAGGSDQVLRNIVGERVLGLPKDAGIDSVTPFRDLPKN